MGFVGCEDVSPTGQAESSGVAQAARPEREERNRKLFTGRGRCREWKRMSDGKRNSQAGERERGILTVNRWPVSGLSEMKGDGN